jgi:hypothetical protein
MDENKVVAEVDILYTVNDSAAALLPGPQRQQHRLFVAASHSIEIFTR